MRPKSANTATKLTPRQRLVRGLTHTAAGPVDVTRGVVGIGAHSARSGAASLRRRYRQSRLAQEVPVSPETVARELAAAQEVVAGLPQALQQARRTQRRSRRRWVVAGGSAVLFFTGVGAVVIIRRSSRPEPPSPRPPSVDVQPHP